MIDLGFMAEYAIPIIVGICICVGYIIKNVVPSEKINRFIPLVMGLIGILLNYWINNSFTAEILLGGLFSGLASTGLYEMFRNLIGSGSK